MATAGVAFTAWAAISQQRAARMMRVIWRDTWREVPPAPAAMDPSTWDPQRVTVGWLGHATVLINFYGLWILTDPVFHDRIGIDLRLGTLGPKRYVRCALKPGQLPPIDVLLLSHAHMDHMDIASLRRVAKPGLTVTAKDTSEILKGTPVQESTELGWGGRTVYRGGKGEMEVEAFEVKHWGRRWPNDRDRGYNAYVLRREGRSLLFGGDTAMTPLFSRMAQREAHLAAIMPIAAYRPWIRNHCTPEEAVRMADAANARVFIPVHHETYKLSDEPMEEPIQRLEAALASEEGRLGLRHAGEVCVVS